MSSTLSLVSLCLLAICSNTFALGPSAVNLGTAANFVVLASSGVSTVPPSAITGSVGLSPAASTFLTGFSPVLDSTGTFATSSQVVGKIFAASYTSPTPSTLTTAISHLQAAYADASSRTSPNVSNLGAGTIGGLVILPGLYKWSSGVNIAGAVTLAGTILDTFIFQITGTLQVAAGAQILLVGGALPRNIVWVVAGGITTGAGSHLEGIFLGQNSITLGTATSVNGRVLAQTSVTLQKAIVTGPV